MINKKHKCTKAFSEISFSTLVHISNSQFPQVVPKYFTKKLVSIHTGKADESEK